MLLTIIILPFIGSLCAAVLPSNARNAEAWLAGILALTCTLLICSLYPQISNGEVIRTDIKWIPEFGLQFILRMDGYSWLFSLIVSLMGTLVALYARYYMSPQDPVPRFFSFFQAFMAAMLGIVLSGNLIQLALFWEMTSLASFMLIAYWHHRSDARRGAHIALIVTGSGGLCLFLGLLIIGHIVGSYDMDKVLLSGDLIRRHSWYPIILTLLAIGTLSKSAQFPFQFWLPNAMAAPTPVSAYLHSATVVKAGVFLLARFWPVLSGTDEWFWIIGGSGLISLILAAYAAIFQQDMKGVLAYSTISHLGLITLLLGLNSSLGLVAAIFHMINHATFKASLFMAAGIVDHETGTRDINRLSGLYKSMPITATLAMVAAASMAGVPLLNGFISKEMFFAETTFVRGDAYIKIGLPLLATLAGIFSVAYSLRFILQVFFGPSSQNLPCQPHEPPRWMLLPSALLVLTCLVVGIMPAPTLGPFLHIAAKSILSTHMMPNYSLSVWHGVKLPLLMSSVALVIGTIFYQTVLINHRSELNSIPFIFSLNGHQAFNFLIEKSRRVLIYLLERLSSSRLQIQITLIIICTLFFAWMPLNGMNIKIIELDINMSNVDPAFAFLWFIGSICALGVSYEAKYHRLSSLTLVGGAGLVTCLTFLWFSAPDLALTQLIVEVVTVVLVLLGLRWLPRRIELCNKVKKNNFQIYVRRLRDLILSICVGLSLTCLSYVTLMCSGEKKIASYFIKNALSEGGGKNIVNVILVNFRGFDTLGEITVLAVVSLAIYALLRRFRPSIESIEHPLQRLDEQKIEIICKESKTKLVLDRGSMFIPSILVNLLVPIAILISIYFLMRGHNLPGGGFVGGLIMATAIILQYMVSGVYWVESHNRLSPQYWIASGLLFACGSAISACLLGHPFLTALNWSVFIPIIGDIHFSTIFLFDLGVYMLVVGSTILILIALAHQSLRAQRKTISDEQEHIRIGVSI